MATADPRTTLADALGALGETLRHHRDLGLRAIPRGEARGAPAQSHPGARQRRVSESPRHPRADRQAPRPRASVRLGGADPDLPSRVPPAQPGRGVQTHGVGGSPARPTGVRSPPHAMTAPYGSSAETEPGRTYLRPPSVAPSSRSDNDPGRTSLRPPPVAPSPRSDP